MKNILLGLASIIIFSFWSCDGAVSKYHLGAQFIGLQPYGDVDTTYLDIAKEAIEDYYGYDVKILASIKLPINARKKTGTRYEYNADKLLIDLRQRLPDNLTKIVGMLDRDLYTRQKDAKSHKIVSKSQRPGKVSVMSTYLVKKYASSTNNFENRLKKIILKEIGHTIGLSSCKDKSSAGDCLMMNSGGSGRVLDDVDYHFCKECAKKINWDDKANNK